MAGGGRPTGLERRACPRAEGSTPSSSADAEWCNRTAHLALNQEDGVRDLARQQRPIRCETADSFCPKAAAKSVLGSVSLSVIGV